MYSPYSELHCLFHVKFLSVSLLFDKNVIGIRVKELNFSSDLCMRLEFAVELRCVTLLFM